jgi:group I intron endonuclease
MKILCSDEDFKKTGVYYIKHLSSGRIYIGSTSHSFRQRLNKHTYKLDNKIHSSKFLTNCWHKYGPEDFEFDILCIVDWTVEYGTADILYVEQFYLDEFNPEFNSATRADSNLGYKWTEEQKEKAKTHFKKIRHLTDLAVTKRRKTFTLYNPELGTITYTGIREFQKEFGVANISYLLAGKVISAKGFFKDEESYLKEQERVKGYRLRKYPNGTEKWVAYFYLDSKHISLGEYDTEIEAKRARKEAELLVGQM